MKYIVFDNLSHGSDVPVVFPDFVEHSDVANAFGGIGNVLSAGFVRIHQEGTLLTVECHGKSIMPDKLPRDFDPHLLSRLLLKH